MPAINQALEKSLLHHQISRSDRVVCLGHGAPQGLLGHGSLIIDEDEAELFRRQTENIYIWCNADCYLLRHELKGFCTGMFISEPMEANIFNVNATWQQIEDSNNLFANIIGQSIDLSCREIKDRVMELYQIEGSKVVEYNRRNVYIFE